MNYQHATPASLAVLYVTAVMASAASAVELNPGDILVIDTAAQQKILFVINPETGEQTLVTPELTFADPSDVEGEPDGGVLVADQGPGQVYRVDPDTGGITPLLDAPLGVTRLGLTVAPNGRIFIAGNTTPNSVRELNEDTGDTTVISEGDFLEQPRDVEVEIDGSLLVLTVGGPGRIVRVDPFTGGQTVVSEGGVLPGATGFDLEGDGNIVVVSTVDDAVTRIDRVTGVQTDVTGDFIQLDPQGIAVDRDGSLLVVDQQDDTVIRFDPISGDATPVSNGGLLVKSVDLAVFGLGVSILSCAGFDTPLDAGPVSVTQEGVVITRAQLFDEDALPVVGGLTAPPVLETEFNPRPPPIAPIDVTGSGFFLPPGLLISLPQLRGNQFFFFGGLNSWVQGLPTEQFRAPGSYRVIMVSGDRNEYVFDFICQATYVVQ